MWGLMGFSGNPGVKSCVIVCSLDITSKGLCWLLRLSIGFCYDIRAVFAVHRNLTEIRTYGQRPEQEKNVCVSRCEQRDPASPLGGPEVLYLINR